MVSIVIPTLFPGPKLENYATSLSRYPTVHEVVIVVNDAQISSSPVNGTRKFQVPSTIRVIYQGKNLGVTGGYNAGARAATDELLLFLNDDCDMSEDALRKMVGFLEQNADVVATQPIVRKQILNSKFEILNDGEKGSLHPRSARSRDDIAQSKDIENIGFWVDTKIGKAYPVTETLNSKIEILREKDRSIYGLSGTCLLIRKDVFEKVGMWDESFHSYLEDVDLAIRLHKAGYKVAPCLDSEVTHEHMATSSKMGLYKEKQDVKNWWRLIFKHPDVFVRPAQILPLLLERARNINGLFKKILRRVIQ